MNKSYGLLAVIKSISNIKKCASVGLQLHYNVLKIIFVYCISKYGVTEKRHDSRKR